MTQVIENKIFNKEKQKKDLKIKFAHFKKKSRVKDGVMTLSNKWLNKISDKKKK